MKIGVLFSLTATLIAFVGVFYEGWFLITLWPALSFAAVAFAYFALGPGLYGKRPDGTIPAVRIVPLAPYLFFMWSVWLLTRVVRREPPYHQLSESIFIGRRLLAHETPDFFDVVVDLTCEFPEPLPLRSKHYYSFQILDGVSPSEAQLIQWARDISRLSGTVYIHCAEGRGRAGLFAAALLLVLGHSDSPSEVLRFIRSKRTVVRLGARQRKTLDSVHRVLCSDLSPQNT